MKYIFYRQCRTTFFSHLTLEPIIHIFKHSMKQHEPILNYLRGSLAYTEKYINKIQNRLQALPWKLFFIDTQKGFYVLKALGMSPSMRMQEMRSTTVKG
mgnify:FL=1